MEHQGVLLFSSFLVLMIYWAGKGDPPALGGDSL